MTSVFSDLLERSVKPWRFVVGLMSGTSADSIDVALCRIRGHGTQTRAELVHYEEHAHDPDLKRQIQSAGELGVRAIAELNVALAEAFAAACSLTFKQAGVDAAEVDLIGSHGQTVYHHSGVEGARRATLQLGDGDIIAVRTRCYVISDFRARDIAAGGEGAPLSPIADMVLFASAELEKPCRRAILNLGGIANLTVLDPDPTRVFGFDTGPANSPLDRLARRLSGDRLACDEDGQFARAGRVNERLLSKLLETDPFLARRPPKSTGFEMYGDVFVAQAAQEHGAYDADLMATLTEFTARSIALGLEQCTLLGPPVDEVVVAGGGVNNPVLIERITALISPARIRTTADLGVPPAAREAMAFAVLADRTLQGLPAFLPPVTGANAPKLLGKVSFP
jgi:anhydro-N-acetylmuramic acid kinase